ncbi:MICOS complex subunit MIC10-like [Gastrolobium bilobum]|uniref:MICOS complex subunit MIC10-like n=1 Tax=Gastrolobium bilobum TaxID=150636 RepID=UPI002AAFD268|nr:MICOS complex subunit MIC10-like [Gastrolobium bilobum]
MIEKRMGKGKKEEVDACVDLTLRRFVYSSLTGAFAGLIFFRSRTARWASIAFGGGVGIGSAYTQCSPLFHGSPPNSASPKVSHTPIQNVLDSE